MLRELQLVPFIPMNENTGMPKLYFVDIFGKIALNQRKTATETQRVTLGSDSQPSTSVCVYVCVNLCECVYQVLLAPCVPGRP